GLSSTSGRKSSPQYRTTSHSWDILPAMANNQTSVMPCSKAKLRMEMQRLCQNYVGWEASVAYPCDDSRKSGVRLRNRPKDLRRIWESCLFELSNLGTGNGEVDRYPQLTGYHECINNIYFVMVSST